jgi:uncharacterized protein YbjT (DUF2867 family)
VSVRADTVPDVDAPLLVTGAEGTVGRHVVRYLTRRGLPVRAAVRTGPREPSPGVEAVRFDFGDPRTWGPAFDGVRGMFLLRPPAIGNVRRDLLPAVAAAQRAGVEHVVFLSLQGADRNRVVPHATVERWLRGSGLEWTFVRPSFFLQNLTSTHAADIRDRDAIVVPAGRGRTAFVDALDVGEVAAATLAQRRRWAGQAVTPTGDVALTYGEVAGILSEVLGRPIRYTQPGLGRYALHAHRTLGLPWGFAAVTAAIYTTARLGLAAGLTDDVRTVLGRPPTTVREFAVRERGSWEPQATRA